jgi:glycosyltransferase involved in cell wall biosynthesis
MATETWAVSMVKDEADIVGQTVAWMLTQVDKVLIADNGSTDGTRDILEGLAVDIVDDAEVGYYQSSKTTALAQRAAEGGAAWVVPFDADEFWYSPFGRIADVLDAHPAAAVLTAELYDHVATALDEDLPVLDRMVWRRRSATPLPKIACRPLLPVTIEQGNHGASYPAGRIDGQLVVRHFPYRSAAQFVSKVRNGAAAYAATDLPHDQGQHWRDYGAILDAHGPGGVHEIFRTWFWSSDPENDPSLIFDPCPR